MTKRKVKKAIAIVGEGITEWMHFDYFRRNNQYVFPLNPDKVCWPCNSSKPYIQIEII
nr:hypothetical protein [uncultured Sphaerochaeta sp.]